MGTIEKLKKYTLRQIINNVLGRIENLFSAPRLRILKTLYVNFRSLPFSQAVQLPIYIYGKVKIYSLSGSIEIKAPIKRGMIKIGNPIHGAVIDTRWGYIRNYGTIVFEGKATICNGLALNIVGGKLIFEDSSLLGEKVRIVCSNYVKIGEGARIAHESQIIDTNFHYMLDTTRGTTRYPKGKIEIGKWCWVANRTTIQKGTILPDYTIVASNSLLNKDYSDIPECSVIGGMPAKLIKTGLRRVFNIKSEAMLNAWFEANGHDAKYTYDGDDTDAFCQ